MTPWVYLSIAILSEVAGTSRAQGDRRLPQFLALGDGLVGYGMAFYFLSLTQSAIPMGVSYAVWSGVGVALISLVGWVYYKQSLGAGELIGIGMIVAGVVVLRCFRRTRIGVRSAQGQARRDADAAPLGDERLGIFHLSLVLKKIAISKHSYSQAQANTSKHKLFKRTNNIASLHINIRAKLHIPLTCG